MAAFTFGVLRRKKRYGQRVLIIVRNEPPLDGVAHSLPSLIVLIVDVPAFDAGMLVNYKQGSGIKGQLLSTGLISIQ